MPTGNSGNRNLIIVAALVIAAAVGISLLTDKGNKTPVESATTATTSSGDTDAGETGTRTTVDAKRVAGNTRATKPSANSPDITFVEWDFMPPTPVRGKPVMVVASIKNDGSKPAPPFNVAWHADADQAMPVHVWSVPKLNPGSRYTLEFEYAGFARGHNELQTMLVIDPEGVVVDKDRTNNEWVRTITVAKQ